MVIGNLGQHNNSIPGADPAQVDDKQYARSASCDSGWDRQCSMIYRARLNTRLTSMASTVTKAKGKNYLVLELGPPERTSAYVVSFSRKCSEHTSVLLLTVLTSLRISRSHRVNGWVPNAGHECRARSPLTATLPQLGAMQLRIYN